MRYRLRTLLILAVVACLVLTALLIPAVQAARESARRAQSSNNLKQIGLALHSYHDVYGTFPPAVVTDKNGRPLYSGRVLLLPWIECQGLYQRFDKSKAWNSPDNQGISDTVFMLFHDSSSSGDKRKTDYLFVTGKGTIFEAGRATKISEITDGTSNTIMLIERKNSGISWAEPRDFDASGDTTLSEGNHPGGNLVLLADGSVRFFRLPSRRECCVRLPHGPEMKTSPCLDRQELSMFRCTIRDLLWLMVVVGLVIGWLIEHQRNATSMHLAESKTALLKAMRELPIEQQYRNPPISQIRDR